MSRLVLSDNDTIMDIWLNRPVLSNSRYYAVVRLSKQRGVKAEKGSSKADGAERA